MRHLLTGAMMLAVAGCAQPELPDKSQIENLDWTLVSLNGEALPGEASIVLLNGRVAGRGPCNAFGASQSATPPAFDLGAIAATKMGCAPELAEAEALLFDALGRIDTLSRDGMRLTMTGVAASITWELGS